MFVLNIGKRCTCITTVDTYVGYVDFIQSNQQVHQSNLNSRFSYGCVNIINTVHEKRISYNETKAQKNYMNI